MSRPTLAGLDLDAQTAAVSPLTGMSVADAGSRWHMACCPLLGWYPSPLTHLAQTPHTFNKARPGPGQHLVRAMDQPPGCVIRRPNGKKIFKSRCKSRLFSFFKTQVHRKHIQRQTQEQPSPLPPRIPGRYYSLPCTPGPRASFPLSGLVSEPGPRASR